MSPYQRDRAFSERFISDIRQIVGPRLLVPANYHRDTKEATDFLLLTARDMRIAARVRGPGYAERYGWQFTTRYRRDTGAETEFSKFQRGLGDWMLYGHADRTLRSIERWILVDLKWWRLWWACRAADKAAKYGISDNRDGTYFAWFDVSTFDPFWGVVIASSHPLPAPRGVIACEYKPS